MYIYHIFSIILAIAPSIAPAQAKCCGSGECVSWSPVPGRPGKPDREICNRWKCDDGFVHGNFQCCGVSKCNVFCCNCDSANGKVCRTPKTLLARGPEFQSVEVEPDSMTDADMFRAANTGGTGNLTFKEFASYFGAQVEDPGLAAKFDL
ncbi:MAG: hypothetical protein M1835_003527 [Candelina submexicana]|nr:MAG: hypothetical protein M1835_003527 [Candelina submexicana]